MTHPVPNHFRSFRALCSRIASATALQSIPMTILAAAAGVGGLNHSASAQPCQVNCNAFNLIAENEPCGTASPASSGCDSTPPGNFLFLRCPEGYCATTWAFNGAQDTDWYGPFVNDPDNDGTENVCFTVTAESPMVVQLWSGNCGSLTLVAQGEASNCVPFTLCACVPAPAQYKVKVYPGTIAGGPTLNGLPCTSTLRDYTLTYQCAGPCSGPTGACCYTNPAVPGSLCVVTTAQVCAQQYNGIWQGPNTVCNAQTCHPAVGACCYIGPDGTPTCVITTKNDCVQNLMGTYQGDGSSCTPDPCSEGACCHQIPGTTIFQCFITTQANCATLFNSTWGGPNSVCPPAPAVCNDPLGACCYLDPLGVQCGVMTAAQCAALPNGTWQGPNTTCNPINPCFPEGACCYTNTAGVQACVITTQAQCHNFYNGIWQGPNTTCSPINPCIPNGACCFQIPGTTIIICQIMTAADCANQFNGVWHGPNTTCNPDPCPPKGACCYTDANGQQQCSIVTAIDCAQNYNGAWQGPNTTCAGVTCPPVGACCYLDATGVIQCAIMTQAQCAGLNGIWQGANTTCNPNPCFPKGACCFQDGPTAPVLCIVTTQQNCANYPQSVWQGPNTTCNPNPCPPSGACCYQVVGTNTWTCVIATPQYCVQVLHGNYQGNNTSCANVDCTPCVRPPLKMVAWWTLDEVIPGTAFDSIGGIHNALAQPNPANGPTPTAAVVGNGRIFDGANDFFQAPHSVLTNFGCGPFSIDAWLFRQGTAGGIVTKTAANGYDFFINAAGQLGLNMASTSGNCSILSVGIVPNNTWTHVAVTATGGGPTRTVTFYINGVSAGSSNTTCVCVGNTAPIRIGRSPFAGFLRGRLDEIEMFRAVLTPAQILGLYQAGSAGKCKTRVHAPANTPFCLNQNTVQVPVTICNDSNVAYNYNVSFQPLNTCQIPGPTIFNPLFSNPVNVPANGCVTVQVIITRPTGMVAAGQVACYQINALNLSTSQTFYGQGSLKDRRDLCAVVVDPPCCIGTGVIGVPVGTPTPISFTITNTSPGPVSFPYMLKAYDAQDGEPSDELRLNGLPPGTRYIGNMTLPPGGQGGITVDAGYAMHNALAIEDIILSTDLDGDGTFDPLISIGVESHPLLCHADIVPTGFVDVDDLLAVINGWGPCPPAPDECPADVSPALAPNGTVNVDDLLAVINGWGPCP